MNEDGVHPRFRENRIIQKIVARLLISIKKQLGIKGICPKCKKYKLEDVRRTSGICDWRCDNCNSVFKRVVDMSEDDDK